MFYLLYVANWMYSNDDLIAASGMLMTPVAILEIRSFFLLLQHTS